MSIDVVTLAEDHHRDPVCGKHVTESDRSLRHEGETFYFCSEICRRQFESEPDLYLKAPDRSVSSFGEVRRDLTLGYLVALFSNFLGTGALAVYFTLVFGPEAVFQFHTTALTISGLAVLAGVSVALWLTKPLITFVLDPSDEATTPSKSTLQRTALNFPIYVALIILAGWTIFGSIGAVGAYLGGTTNYAGWFLHIFLGTLYSGLVVSIGTFYVTEALFARNVLPFLMGDDKPSSLDGVLVVPTWLRISLLVVTTAVFPMGHIIGLHYQGDASTGVLLYFIGGVVGVAVLQGFYILRSISLPIGRIAGEFERFQTGRPLNRSLDIYRADDLGRFAEMFEDLVSTIHERDFLQRTFGRYMSQQVLDEILDGQIELGGKRQTATVLFADIRDFTRLTETMEPENVVRLLNEYFEHMVQGITEFNGIPDKFLGDGLMAIWGVPVETENHPNQGVRAGFEMLNNLRKFNEKQRKLDRPTLRIGTSLHTGELIAGNIGSRQKMEYTVVGDTVNTCSRLESVNKEMDSVMTISEAVYKELAESLQEHFEAAGTVRPRGKNEAIAVHTVREPPGRKQP